jgi:hypothetical protein
MALNKREQYAGTVISFFAILLLSSYITMPMVGFNDKVILLLAMSALMLAIMVLCIFVFRAYSKQHKSGEIDYLNIGTQRYILGLFMIFYGVPKLLGNFFDYQLSALDTKLVDVSEFELAWYYFGKNRWQELFSGIMEFVPGLLLLKRRTYYTAALILLPVTAQVFILNLFFHIGGVTFPAASILLACNLYIIYSQKEKIVQFFKSLDFSVDYNLGSVASRIVKVLRWTGIVLAVLVVFIGVRPVLFKSAYQKKYEKLVGVYAFEKMKKNNIDYVPVNDSAYYKDLYIEKQSRWNVLRRFNNKGDAFILNLDNENDSIAIYINKGGTGDDPDIIDSLTVLKGTYKLDSNEMLTITGVQLNDTLQFTYRKQNISPKKWFW